jgi:hypothetical protein
VSGIWGRQGSKGVCTPRYIYTNKPRYDRDLKNTDVVVVNRVSVHNILKELGQNNKEQAEILSILTLILVLI